MIDYEKANFEANQISSDAVDLQHALKRMADYKASINANWSGSEVVYINKAIEDVVSMIKKSINDMNQLSKDVKKTAADIEKEEKALAAKAKAEKDKKIKAAQNNLDIAIAELSALNEQKQSLEEQIKLLQNNAFDFPKIAMMIFELNDINAKIKTAEQNYETCINALNAAKR